MPSKAPKSRSRSRSSVRTRTSRPAVASCAVVRARLKGELSAAVGRSSSGSSASHLPSASACARPVSDSGTSGSRTSSSSRPAFALCARASATLPMLSPCRTSQTTWGPGSRSATRHLRPAAGAAPPAPVAAGHDPETGRSPGRMSGVTLPTDLPVLAFADQAALEAWLEAEDATAPGRLREARQEGRGRAVGDLRGAGRVLPVLRLDRRAVQPARRLLLPAAHHARAGPAACGRRRTSTRSRR